jgi:ELWxxDGT repeat protein
MKINILFALTIILFSTCAKAQLPQFVKDINTLNPGGSQNAIVLTHINDTIFFFANDGIHGMELWRSDGSEHGTYMVKDINPGAGNGVAFDIDYREASGIQNVNGILYFHGLAPGQNGLWKSDGTEAGTVFIKSVDELIGLGSGWSTHIGETLYFSAGKNGNTQNGDPPLPELWKSDGTAAGTMRVKEGLIIEAGLTVMGGQLFFSGKAGGENTYLWKSNGTPDGTSKIRMLDNGVEAYYPQHLIVWKDSLYFSAIHPSLGKEVWVSNGTEAGTNLLRDIWTGSNDGFYAGLQQVGSQLYFFATDGISGRELWKTNGTEAVTELVKDLNTGAGGVMSFPEFFTFQNKLYFIVDATNDIISNPELWVSDGTSIGTVRFFDTNTLDVTNIGGMTQLGDTFFFQGLTNDFGTTLLKTDGTRDSVWQVSPDVSFATTLGIPYNTGHKLFFNFTNLSFKNIGVELWATDGTAANTELLKDISKFTSGSNPQHFYAWGNDMYFSADDGIHGTEPWKLNGTTGKVELLKDLEFSGNVNSGSSNPSDFFAIGDVLYFVAFTTENGRELWKTNGTAEGTVQVKNIRSGSFSSNPAEFVNVDGILYFTASSVLEGTELWRSDGTTDGTLLVKDIRAGNLSSTPRELTNVNGVLYFTAFDSNGIELWKSDGTNAGTVMVKNIFSGGGSSTPVDLTSFNGLLYFSATDGSDVNRIKLWKSDGTIDGTQMVMDSNGDQINSPFNLYVVDSLLYFGSFSAQGNHGLWRSNGTHAGTFKIKDIELTSSSKPPFRAAIGNKFIASANDGISGSELWISDGTETGTYLVKDIAEGLNASSNPQSFMVANNKLYFVANHAEIWETDTTIAGTKKLMNLYPFDINGLGPYLTLAGNNIYFAASDSVKGKELWKLDLVNSSATAEWTGNVNKTWENPFNWSNHMVPGNQAKVYIPSGLVRYPTINTSTTVLSLTCQNGAVVNIAPGVILNIQNQ